MVMRVFLHLEKKVTTKPSQLLDTHLPLKTQMIRRSSETMLLKRAMRIYLHTRVSSKP